MSRIHRRARVRRALFSLSDGKQLNFLLSFLLFLLRSIKRASTTGASAVEFGVFDGVDHASNFDLSMALLKEADGR